MVEVAAGGDEIAEVEAEAMGLFEQHSCSEGPVDHRASESRRSECYAAA